MIWTKAQASVRHGLLRPLRKLGLAASTRWPWPIECETRSGQRLYVDMRSTVGRTIFVRGEFDPGVFQPLAERLRSGDTFVDVGSNVGYYSVLALPLVGPTGAVHAFEVDQRPLRCLRRTVKKQNLRNLHVHRTAVGSYDGSAYFYADPEAGNSRLASGTEGSKIEVPVITLDSWYREAGKPKVAAIKLDVEGAEPDVLMGARELLLAQRPCIVCEAWDSDIVTSSRAAVTLKELGFSVTPLEGVHSPCFVATAK